MPTEFPGYTPPASGSSKNDGTHPLSSYTGIETAVSTFAGTDGADNTQVPPQYYGAWTSQKRNKPELHSGITGQTTGPTAP